MENWKDIKDYEGLYQVSNLGRVRNIKLNNQLKPSINTNGYYRVSLRKNGKDQGFKVHRLVAIHFIDNPLNNPVINHINGDKSDNTMNNLEWVTYRENSCHGFINKDVSSKFTGVNNGRTKKSKNDTWRARICVNGKNVELGSYKTQEEAYNARVKYEQENNISNKYLYSGGNL